MDLKTNLISAALSLLESEQEPPSLRAVARAAGVSAMAPYRHFADKDALMTAVADQGFLMLSDALQAADDSTDAKAALIAQGCAFTDFARRNPSLYRLMFGAEFGLHRSQATRSALSVMEGRVGALAPDNAAVARLACFALVQGLANIEMTGRAGPIGARETAAVITFVTEAIVNLPEKGRQGRRP